MSGEQVEGGPVQADTARRRDQARLIASHTENAEESRICAQLVPSLVCRSESEDIETRLPVLVGEE